MKLEDQLYVTDDNGTVHLDFAKVYDMIAAAQPDDGNYDINAINSVADVIMSELKKIDENHPLTKRYGMENAPVSDLKIEDREYDGAYCYASTMFGGHLSIHFDTSVWDARMHWGSHTFESEEIAIMIYPSGVISCQIQYDCPGDPEVRGHHNDYVSAALRLIFDLPKS